MAHKCKVFLIVVAFFFTGLYANSNNDLMQDIQNNFGKPTSQQQKESLMSFDKAVKLYNDGKTEEAGEAFLSLFLKGDFKSSPYLADIFALGLAPAKQNCKLGAYFLYAGISNNLCSSYNKLIEWIEKGVCSNLTAKEKEQRKEKYKAKLNKCTN